jgi:hypothetical protein
MARITCKYSGVIFNCEHMPLGLSSNEYYHPLFSVPKKKLLVLSKEWAANKLSPRNRISFTLTYSTPPVSLFGKLKLDSQTKP